ncbi:MAG: glycosyltransferase family protein, partial [Bdellovibrionales bacterium]|nr:glycosyltransferase family protein [Bdellovibrionales bacterium]
VPVLDWCLRRLSLCPSLDTVVVATSTLSRDDVIESHCRSRGWECFRGSEYDVLDRYYQAARAFSATEVVRVTSDCPFIDPQLVRSVVALFHEANGNLDYASNIHPRTFPRGLDVEIVSFRSLEAAWSETQETYCREHVTPLFYQNPQRFRLGSMKNDVDLSALQWSLDTIEDYEPLKQLSENLSPETLDWRTLVAKDKSAYC